MVEAKSHEQFAKAIHGEVWRLLENPHRTKEETERMVYAVHASCYHWLHAGSGVNHQRGEWFIARVYTVLEDAAAATQHARRCLELTEQHASLLEDFDFAFAYELMARAAALRGDRAEAADYLPRARKAGTEIKDPEDRKVFFDDFFAYPWFGFDPGPRPADR
jgi:hypothetical protein